MGPVCRLSGYPNLEGSTPTERWRPLRVGTGGTYFGDLGAANIATGRSGLLLMGTSAGCPALNSPSSSQVRATARAFTYHAIRIVFARGGRVGVDHLHLDVACGLDESQFGARRPLSGAGPIRPGSAATLVATVSLARAVRAGTTVSYVVTLHNPTATPVAFTPCPHFTESIFVAPDVRGTRPVSRTYALNCTQASAIGPHESERFAMRIDVPRSGRTSIGKFSWSLEANNGAHAGTVVTVLAPRSTHS